MISTAQILFNPSSFISCSNSTSSTSVVGLSQQRSQPYCALVSLSYVFLMPMCISTCLLSLSSLGSLIAQYFSYVATLTVHQHPGTIQSSCGLIQSFLGQKLSLHQRRIILSVLLCRLSIKLALENHGTFLPLLVFIAQDYARRTSLCMAWL